MPGTDPRPQWWQELLTSGAFVRRSRPPQLLAALTAAVVFTVLGAGLVAEGGGGTVAGVAGVAFFGVLGIPVLTWRLVTGQPVLRIDAIGVAVGRVAVGWTEIAEVGRWQAVGPAVVVLRLTPEGAARLAARTSAATRLLRAADDRLIGAGGSTVAVPTGLGLPAEPLAAWLTELQATR